MPRGQRTGGSDGGRAAADPVVTVEFDGQALSRLFKDLRGIDNDLGIELRRTVKQSGSQIAESVRRNAAAASVRTDRLPRSIKTGSTFRRRTAGFTVRADRRIAPHARPLENTGGQGFFRHPVYGNRQVWRYQAAQPFFLRAATPPVLEQAAADLLDAVEQLLVRNGFRSSSS